MYLKVAGLRQPVLPPGGLSLLADQHTPPHHLLRHTQCPTWMAEAGIDTSLSGGMHVSNISCLLVGTRLPSDAEEKSFNFSPCQILAALPCIVTRIR